MDAADQEFLRSFEDCSLPFGEWRHRAHVKVAFLLLTRYPFEQACERMRDGIRRYNAAHHVPEGPTMGYHETMTMAWLRLIHGTIGWYGSTGNADSFFEAHPELWQSKILRLFYSPERIMSARARTHYLEPDLTPFPEKKETR